MTSNESNETPTEINYPHTAYSAFHDEEMSWHRATRRAPDVTLPDGRPVGFAVEHRTAVAGDVHRYGVFLTVGITRPDLGVHTVTTPAPRFIDEATAIDHLTRLRDAAVKAYLAAVT